MTHYKPYKIIEEVTEALADSVPRKHYNEVLSALSRCREMIANLATVVAEIDKEQKHGELMLEAKLYASIIGGFFSEAHRGPFETNWADIKSGFNPREYLKDKGVIKPDLKEAAAKAEEQAKELREKAIKARAWTPPNLRVMISEEAEALIAQITRKPKKRGRPIGSKNKPKDVLKIPALSDPLGHMRRGARGRKVGSKNKPKTGGVK